MNNIFSIIIEKYRWKPGREFRWAQRLSFATLLMVISACGGNGSKVVPIASVNSDNNLPYLLKQISQAPTSKKSPLLLQAANLLISEKRFDKAQELLLRVNPQTLMPDQLDDFRLYRGEVLLQLNALENSLNQLLSVKLLSRKSMEWQVRYNRSLSDSYLANGNYFEAAKLRIELDDLINDADKLAENNEKIWFALNQIEANFLQHLITDFNDKRLNGWLEVVYINKKWGYHPKKLLEQLTTWRQRYPLHPSQVSQPKVLQEATNAENFDPKSIAVLLPLSGKNGNIGQLIRDGILAAHYRSESAETAPLITFYDTANALSGLTPYQQAIDAGADFIVGPLTKSKMENIIQQETINTPILALNQLADYSHPNVFQFGLPPEDEAIQAAHRAFEKGFKKAIALLPQNSVGTRVESSFRNYFEELGGELIDVQYYKDSQSLKNDVQSLLGVDSSSERKRNLQQLLGRNLEFEMRRRQDADFIFLVATPNMGRIAKPFIDYYYAYDLPIIATSQVYSGQHDPQTDIDLNGIEFSDIPLLLSELPEFNETREQLKEIQPEVLDARGRYFALGYDSYQLMPQLPMLKAFPEYRLSGLTGELGIDKQGLIHRYLTWAQFNKGIPTITKERELRQLEAGVINPNTLELVEPISTQGGN